jgi:phospholipase/carboxylesterase
MEQPPHGKGNPMEDDTALTHLLATLDTLGHIARMMHPARLPDLVAQLPDAPPQPATSEQIQLAATYTSQACTGLRSAPHADNPMLEAYRALRQYSRALEALIPLAETNPQISRYFLEPGAPIPTPHPDSGLYHSNNQTTERGGFSAYVPPGYDPAKPTPIIFALHGGSGHGRLFLTNWIAESRSRTMIVVAPTAIGSTWSLMDPEIDTENLGKILTRMQDRWNIDPNHRLLSGMSDGGTFTLLSGLATDSPFTHLAPVAASFHPMLLAMTEPQRLTGLPIHLTHGALDWMFPVSMARTAHRMLAAAGAAITYREIADLSHAYPRDGQGEVLDWFTSQPR